MGCSDVFCVICGCDPYHSSKEDLEELFEFESEISHNKIPDISWLQQCTMLVIDGNIYHDYIETGR